MSRGEILKNKGLRKTLPRIAVLSILQTAPAPLSINDIRKNKRARGIDQATLYRTLETFKKSSIVRQTDLQQGRAYFELSEGRPDHHHIVCTECGITEDFTGCSIDLMTTRALKQVNRFSAISGHAIELFGVCAPCGKN